MKQLVRVVRVEVGYAQKFAVSAEFLHVKYFEESRKMS
jgi:hypothetical protein